MVGTGGETESIPGGDRGSVAVVVVVVLLMVVVVVRDGEVG